MLEFVLELNNARSRNATKAKLSQPPRLRSAEFEGTSAIAATVIICEVYRGAGFAQSPCAGLYRRNGRFYAQLWVDRGCGKKAARRFALFTADNLPARTLPEAKEAMEIKRNERREDSLPILGRKPIFGDYCNTTSRKPRCSANGRGRLKMNGKQSLVGDHISATFGSTRLRPQ